MADAKILGDDFGRCVRHPIGEQNGLVFGEVAVVEDQQKFAAVGGESLDGVGDAGWEKPEVVVADVGDETFTFGVDAGDARACRRA